MKNADFSFDKCCFVVSPICKEGTEDYQRFRAILEDAIRPAVDGGNFGLTAVRADEINRTGSFIRDIFEYIAKSHIVIAVLTNQNPNVFYELGVRHVLSQRTILIAQSIDDIPSDLRIYRTIIYGAWPDGKEKLIQGIKNYLRSIEIDPDRSDNPVLDVLGESIPSLKNDLMQSFTARIKSCGNEQSAILQFISDNTPNLGDMVERGTILDHFSGYKDSELYYRLEKLRLLDLIVKKRADKPSKYLYCLSAAYRRDLDI